MRSWLSDQNRLTQSIFSARYDYRHNLALRASPSTTFTILRATPRKHRSTSSAGAEKTSMILPNLFRSWRIRFGLIADLIILRTSNVGKQVILLPTNLAVRLKLPKYYHGGH